MNVLSLAAASDLVGTETLYVVQGGSDKKVTAQQIKDFTDGSSGGSATVTTKGDLASYSTAPGRLPVGSNGQVLVADSSVAFGIKWAAPTSVPLTNKGDIATFGTALARLPVGTDGQSLVADSSQTLGIKWATPASAPSTAAANLFYAGPSSGASAAPTFRAIARADLPLGVQGLTDAATISIDASLQDNFRVNLSGNRTLANPTNLRDGQVINIRIAQDSTGGRTLAYGTKYKFPGGTAPVLSTASSAKDFMSCQYDVADDTLFCVLNKAFA